ncbi:MAG: DUF1329 domain-containing protein, partial [Candidatus Binataceae bacterium]
MNRTFCFGVVAFVIALATAPVLAQVKPGDVITKENAPKVKDLLSPGNYQLVLEGMHMNIVPSTKLEWPPPYTQATEKYSSQTELAPDGTLKNFTAGLPFPLVDANDPNVATKIMWNFSFRPLYSDDIDARGVEVSSYGPSGGEPLSYFTVGHFSFYNNIGRIEVPPIPTDPDAADSGIRYRFGFYPFLEPSGMRGFGLLRYRHIEPDIEDNVWVYAPNTRRIRRQSPEALSDALGMLPGFGGGSGGGGQMGGAAVGGGSSATYVNTLDPDSYFGFAAKVENYTYKFLGDKSMLAVVHARNSPAEPCPSDGGRSICPENWEMRRVYAVEATVKPKYDLSVPKRVLYIDAEGWLITASDLYDRKGGLWRTIATFHAYRDRPVPDAKVAIYPYKRMFQTALVDMDLEQKYSSVVYMPGRHSPERECW